ncbi:polyphenol oxidase family protein [Candidatus Uhrbacteria bacterium]|nr:polyphenol oxidase family protein [Candidatus Uhrbacteria bacterium]
MQSQKSEVSTQNQNEITPLLPITPWLVAGISERRHGNLRLGPRGETIDVLCRARFAFELGIPPERVIASVPSQTAAVCCVDSKNLESVSEADAFITAESNLFLSVTVADEIPLFLVDPSAMLAGLVRLDWRNLLRGIITETVIALEKLGGHTDDLRVALGPSLRSCHAEIDLTAANQLRDHLGADVVLQQGGRLFLDLPRSVFRSLGRTGVPPSNIAVSPVCTFCEERYFSQRRDSSQGLGIEAMMAVIGMKE